MITGDWYKQGLSRSCLAVLSSAMSGKPRQDYQSMSKVRAKALEDGKVQEADTESQGILP